MFYCENCFKPINKTIYYLNRMARHPRNIHMHHLLQQFLHQLLSQRMSLTAMQFFDVNFKSFTDVRRSIVVAITLAMIKHLYFSAYFSYGHVPGDIPAVYAQGGIGCLR